MMRILHLIFAVMIAAALLCIVSMLAELLKACLLRQPADDLIQVLAVAAAR